MTLEHKIILDLIEGNSPEHVFRKYQNIVSGEWMERILGSYGIGFCHKKIRGDKQTLEQALDYLLTKIQ